MILIWGLRMRSICAPGGCALLSTVLYQHFYSAAVLHAMQSAVIQQFRLSVRPSVTRWYPIQTNEHRITLSLL